MKKSPTPLSFVLNFHLDMMNHNILKIADNTVKNWPVCHASSGQNRNFYLILINSEPRNIPYNATRKLSINETE
jgi:hypothetical protein